MNQELRKQTLDAVEAVQVPFSVVVTVIDATTQKPVSRADVYLDNKKMGTTDTNDVLTIHALQGSHTIRVKSKGYQDYTATIVVTQSATLPPIALNRR